MMVLDMDTLMPGEGHHRGVRPTETEASETAARLVQRVM